MFRISCSLNLFLYLHNYVMTISMLFAYVSAVYIYSVHLCATCAVNVGTIAYNIDLCHG